MISPSALFVIALLFPAVPAPQTTAPAAAAPAIERALAFPVPAGPIEIPADASLSSLVDLYARATGQHFMMSVETRNLLQLHTLGMETPLSVPPDSVQRVFEMFLLDGHFLLSIASEHSPRMLRIHALHGDQRHNVRSSATFLAADRADLMQAHPAMLFTTVIDLPRIDARQLANSLRAMLTDNNVQQILPAGNSNGLVVTAPGGELAELVELLLLLSDVSVPVPAPVAAPAKTEEAK